MLWPILSQAVQATSGSWEPLEELPLRGQDCAPRQEGQAQLHLDVVKGWAPAQISRQREGSKCLRLQEPSSVIWEPENSSHLEELLGGARCHWRVGMAAAPPVSCTWPRVDPEMAEDPLWSISGLVLSPPRKLYPPTCTLGHSREAKSPHL